MINDNIYNLINEYNDLKLLIEVDFETLTPEQKKNRWKRFGKGFTPRQAVLHAGNLTLGGSTLYHSGRNFASWATSGAVSPISVQHGYAMGKALGLDNISNSLGAYTMGYGTMALTAYSLSKLLIYLLRKLSYKRLNDVKVIQDKIKMYEQKNREYEIKYGDANYYALRINALKKQLQKVEQKYQQDVNDTKSKINKKQNDLKLKQQEDQKKLQRKKIEDQQKLQNIKKVTYDK